MLTHTGPASHRAMRLDSGAYLTRCIHHRWFQKGMHPSIPCKFCIAGHTSTTPHSLWAVRLETVLVVCYVSGIEWIFGSLLLLAMPGSML